MESCIVSPAVEADGVGEKGRTSCALAGDAKIPLIASQHHEAREMQTRRKRLETTFFAPQLANVTKLCPTLTFFSLSFLSQSRQRGHYEM
jgi:hypothetical protein